MTRAAITTTTLAGRLKAMLPWYAKIAAKIVLARLPVPYHFWHRAGVFRHGDMDSAQYALQVFDAHAQRAGLAGGLEGKTLLELGPGDSIATAVIAFAHGARAILVDAGRFAKEEIGGLITLCTTLRSRGLNPPDIRADATVDEILATCRAEYHTGGLASWLRIESQSVDLVFSQAVLEHVRSAEFDALMHECRRVLKPTGICSHTVDLRDHLGGGLNNMRFSESTWESPLFIKSGFYTNRIRYSPMIDSFRRAGFDVATVSLREWDRAPIARSKLANEFSGISDEDLLISGFTILLTKAGDTYLDTRGE